MPQLTPDAVAAGRLRDRPQPTLYCQELSLRPWSAEDAPAVLRAYQDPAIQRWHVRSMDEPEAADWVASWPRRWHAETAASWAVVSDGNLVGRTGFRELNLVDGLAEAAYWTVPEARGRNVATRALTAASQWLLTDGGLHRIELIHSVENAASCAVAERAGYRYEGTRRSHSLHGDGWHDMHLHALLAQDLAAC